MKILSMRPQTKNIVALICSQIIDDTGMLLEPSTVHAIANMVDFQICETVQASTGWTPEERQEFLARGVSFTEIGK